MTATEQRTYGADWRLLTLSTSTTNVSEAHSLSIEGLAATTTPSTRDSGHDRGWRASPSIQHRTSTAPRSFQELRLQGGRGFGSDKVTRRGKQRDATEGRGRSRENVLFWPTVGLPMLVFGVWVKNWPPTRPAALFFAFHLWVRWLKADRQRGQP